MGGDLCHGQIFAELDPWVHHHPVGHAHHGQPAGPDEQVPGPACRHDCLPWEVLRQGLKRKQVDSWQPTEDKRQVSRVTRVTSVKLRHQPCYGLLAPPGYLAQGSRIREGMDQAAPERP